MKSVIVAFLASSIACWGAPLLAQSTAADTQVRLVATRFEQAWNEHDMKALASLFTEDADFVNVGAQKWKGRKEIEEQHVAGLSKFAQSNLATKAVTVQLLKPDIALAHVAWSLEGDKDPDGTPRKPREGLFTWVVVKRNGVWLIRAAQNTNLSNLPPPAAPKS